MRVKNNYDPIRDFSPITLLMKAPQVMVVNAGSPITSIKELIAAAKAKPGGLTFALAGIGSSGHLRESSSIKPWASISRTCHIKAHRRR